MIPLMFAAIAGGFATVAALWPYDAAIAFLMAPIGGSLSAGAMAVLLGLRAREGHGRVREAEGLRKDTAAA
jgi:hypothetical protein